jgi:hypothetical protein
MISKPVALGLFGAACISAAAGGAYVAVRQNHPAPSNQVALSPASPQTPGKAEQGVAETEAVVTPTPAVEAVTPSVARNISRPAGPKPERPAATKKDSAASPARSETPRSAPSATTAAARETAATVERPSPAGEPEPATVPALPATPPEPVISELPAPPRPTFVEVVVPSSSVVGLNVQTSITSETARVEDRVEARVTRDVIADGRVAIPAGTRVLGDVTLVERGGKMKDKARLGVRFHTLVLADNTQVPFRTDAIFREGSSPGNEASRKIGGAAIGGAILGAIIGGAKGAAIGGATGAAGGSAVVMAGDRNAATLPAGTVVTVRLNAPVAVDVEREQ